jgi:hypothetical protein
MKETRSGNNRIMTERPEAIRLDYLNGMTYKAIAEKYGIDQRTAKRYVEKNLPLSEYEHRSYKSGLDPYKHLIWEWMKEGPIYASVIYDWLTEQGYRGSYSIVNRYIQSLVQENEKKGLYPSGMRRKKVLPSLSMEEKIREEKKNAAY